MKTDSALFGERNNPKRYKQCQVFFRKAIFKTDKVFGYQSKD